MKPTIINHALRTISINYNSDVSLSEFESNALKQYQLLHDDAMLIKNGLLEMQINIREMKEKLCQLTLATEKLEDATKLYRYFAGYTDTELTKIKPGGYTLQPEELRKETYSLSTMIDVYWLKRDKLTKLLKELKEKDEILDTDFSTFRDKYESPIIRQWETMEIDTVSLDRDVNMFCEELTAINKLHTMIMEEWNAWTKDQNELVIVINVLDNRIKNALDKTSTMATVYCNEEGKLIDSSARERLFMVKPDDPIIKKYKQTFDNVMTHPGDDLVLIVEPDVVRDLEVGMIHELLIALQHYPRVIDQLVFSIDFNFRMMEGLDIKLGEMEWKTQPAYYRWFHEIGKSPIAIFFIKDNDARLYTLAGDMMADGKIKAKNESGEKYSTLIFNDHQIKVFTDRLFHNCWFFLMYCHGSGFDPRIYIDALIAEYDMPFSFEEVKKKYDEDISKGIDFRARRKN